MIPPAGQRDPLALDQHHIPPGMADPDLPVTNLHLLANGWQATHITTWTIRPGEHDHMSRLPLPVRRT